MYKTIYPALFVSFFVKENVRVTFLFTKDEIPQTVFKRVGMIYSKHR